MRRLFTNWWFVSSLIVVILLALFLYGLPLVVSFLRPWWVRALFGVLILGVWGLLIFLRIRKARKASQAIADELTKTSAADEEGKVLAGRMREALTSLKSASGKKRDYLYSRPWYVIIGPPGAGKTTALLNSGLRFPLAEQAFKGVGGTRNLDFWFADEAALVDTAGRYTTQDSDQEVDSRGWGSFLGLLKKHRPLQPINGIIVAIGIDELIRSDCAQIDAHAAAVRRRLAEVRNTLEVSAPVYVMVTKADLLAGFTEYFEDLDFEGRRAVLGATLPFAGGNPGSEALARAFDGMTKAISARQAKRLFEEMDSHRRSLILGFPSQLQSLRSRLMRFLDGAFIAGGASNASLRGFYLTSGVQEGAPLDRILSGMADVYDRAAQPARPGASGKAYFLNRLLTEVMFEEAGLVQMDPKARSRQKARLAAMFVAVGVTTLLTITAWGVSFARNRDFQGDMLAAATQSQEQIKQDGLDLIEVRDSDPDLRQALPALNALRNLPQGYAAAQAGGPALTMRFGLFQRGLADQAQEAYREGLRRIMLPRLLYRLEQYMQTNSGDAMALYEPLKVYLMLGGQGPLEPKAVEAYITGDWARELYAGSDSAAERGELATHLKALLEDENLAAAWPGRKASLAADLVRDVRIQVQGLSAASRAYAVMRQKAATAGEPWVMASLLSEGDAQAFASPDAVMATQVPYFFTRDGYEKQYLISLASVQKDIEKDAWVLGSNAESIRSEIGNIRPGVAGLYAQEYVAAWEGVVNVLAPADFFNNPTAFGAFTKEPSPLERVLIELRKNTSFAGGASAVASRVVNQRMGSSRIGQAARDYGAGRESGLDAGAQIAAHFRDLHDYVGDGKQPGPIKDFVAAVKQAGQAVIAARSAVSAGAATDQLQAALAAAIAQVQTAGATAPPLLQKFVQDAAGGGAQAQVSTVTGAVATSYSEVANACREVAQERYPFFGTAEQDASMIDVIRVFGPGGTVDGFVQQRLAPLIDNSGPVWRWRSDNPITAQMDPASPEEFAKAAEVRDLLVGGVQLKVAVERVGSDTGAVEFSSGNSTQRWDRGSGGAKPLSWSPQANPEAYIVMHPATEGKGAPARISAEGPWALFRLMDQAEKQNAGPQSIRATFRSGGHWATLLIQLPSERNPFSRGGTWSFRCPGVL